LIKNFKSGDYLNYFTYILLDEENNVVKLKNDDTPTLRMSIEGTNNEV
jgi:hypothetical protein